jgi:gluconate 2-dehydrogenase gamma chain
VKAVTESERSVLMAAMDRILPGGAEPGATEANAIAYADWLSRQDEFQSIAGCCSTSLALLDGLARATYGKSFPACSDEERDALLQGVQAVPHPTVQKFFVTLIRLTLSGFLCAPHYGGNRGCVGWRHIGFQPHRLTAGSGEMPGG